MSSRCEPWVGGRPQTRLLPRGAAGPCSPGWTTWPQGSLCQLSPAVGEHPQRLLPWPGDRAHPGQVAQQGTLSDSHKVTVTRPSRWFAGAPQGQRGRGLADHSRALGLAFPTQLGCTAAALVASVPSECEDLPCSGAGVTRAPC